MTRADWQQIAEERLLAAQTLLAASNWPSAYYLAGYALECGLKSCILTRLAAAPEVIFLERRFSEKCWTHEIWDLVKLSGLESVLLAETMGNPILGQNWLIAKDWSVNSRFQMKTEADAEDLYDAIADNANGVMQWIRARW